MEKLLNAINKEQSKYYNNYNDNGLKVVNQSGNVVYLKDNANNDYACRVSENGRYKKDSFHLTRSFLEICYG